jgi:cell division septation protein DedD
MSEVAALRSAIVHQPTTAGDTYLASSEALLENFETPAYGYRSEPTMEQPAKSGFANWNTPLGIGALLLLLVASAGFGFLLVNPTVAQNLFRGTPLAQFWASPLDEEAAIAPDELVIEESDETADFDGPPLNSLSPDLSQREFSELDLNTLSNLPSGGERTVDRAPAVGVEESEAVDAASDRETRRATTANPSAREPQEVNEMPQTTTPAPRPQATAPTYEQPYQAPAPTSAPAPQSSPATPAPTPQPAPSATETAPTSREPISSYYVVSDYTGDPSLESAREVVEDAYVRNFYDGARIQLGAFNTEEGAATLVEELQSQGIEVRIYEP